MVPGEKVFMGARQGRIFVFFVGRYWGGSKVTKIEKYFDDN